MFTGGFVRGAAPAWATLLFVSGAWAAQDPAGGPGSGSFRKAAKRVLPAVVTIRSDGALAAPWVLPNPLPGPFNAARDWQRRLLDRNPAAAGVREGSGLVVDAKKGLVLTSDGLVGPSGRAVVILPDGRTERVPSQVRLDPESGLVLLVIDPAGLQDAEWRDATTAEPGDWVLAAGRTLALGGQVSAGVVSQNGEGPASGTADPLLLTDAKAVPGGPLVDGDGRVVGVVVDPSRAQAAAMQGFAAAVPAGRARKIAGDLSREGVVRRSYLGVSIGTPDRRAAARVGAEGGVLIQSVVVGGPAQRADVRVGDVVLKVGDVPTRTPRDLRRAVEEAKPGEPLTLLIDREGTRIMVQVTPESGPGAAPPARPAPPAAAPGANDPPGDLRPLDEPTETTRRSPGR